MELIAQKSLRYAGKSLVAGDKFEASAKDARLLKAIKKAADAPATYEEAGAAYDKDAAGYEKQGRRGKYQTRRMKAVDDVAEEPVTAPVADAAAEEIAEAATDED